jgi:hypothetical protein
MLLVTVGAGRPLTAQETQIAGIHGGATVSALSNWEGALFSEGRRGGTAGVFFARAVNRAAQLNLEVNWVQMGGPDVKLDYVDIPITFGGGIVGWNSGANVRAYVGASVGFKVSCSADDSAFDPCASAKRTQWTLPLGLVFGKWLESGRFLGLDTRFLWGLSDVANGLDAKVRSWQFRVVLGNLVAGG